MGIFSRTFHFLFLYFLLVNSNFALSEEEKFDDLESVVLVNVVFRHGDRNPIDLYPTDPYKNVSYWKEGFGQLTDVSAKRCMLSYVYVPTRDEKTALGKEQHYRFGQYIRLRYGNILPATYNLNDVLIRSTDVDRTLMSAESHLAGLYPPVETWQPGLQWQPIPVHTVPEKMDNLLSMKKPCPRYDKEYRKAMDSPEVRKVNEDYKQWYDYISENTGEEIRDPVRLQYVFNTLYIENLRKMKLPEWTKKVFPDKMTDMSAFSFTLAAYTKELQRLKGGPLLGEMVHHMKEKSKGHLSPDRKMFMYSAHDTTVSNLLMTLGVFDPQTPPYTAAVFVQLHRSPQNEFSVSVLFRNDSSRDPYPLQLPGCSYQCPLEQFIAITKPVIPENWEHECGLRSEEGMSLDDAQLLENLTVAVMTGSGVVAILVVALIVLAVLYWKKNQQNVPYYTPLRMEGP